MIKTNVESNKVQGLADGNIVFLKSFEQNMILDERVTNFWFEYHTENEKYPFEFAAKITRNWLDDQDKTPIVELKFSTIMAENKKFFCIGNDVLKDPSRKKEIQNLFFNFENILLEHLKQQNLCFGYERVTDCGLFNDYQWFLQNKGVTPSGRKETVENLEFENSQLWDTKEEYKKTTLFSEGDEAKHFIRYFLSNHHCDNIIKDFLQHILNSEKEIRIIKETSHWKYNFVVRPDMLAHDSQTLSRLGQNIQFNFSNHEDRLAAMVYVFDFFSTFGIVNLCMDEKTIKEINSEHSFFKDNPVLALMNLQQKIEDLTLNAKDNKKDDFQKFQKTHNGFMDGLLDLHNKYQSLYTLLGDQKYNRRVERLKKLWLKCNR